MSAVWLYLSLATGSCRQLRADSNEYMKRQRVDWGLGSVGISGAVTLFLWIDSCDVS